MAVVYKHYREDNGNCFYIGIGNNSSRAYDFRGRNNHWKHTYNKTDVRVEIAIDNVSYEQAKSWEVYLIGLYGRRDLGTGALVNMTDGGDGSNKSKEAIQKQLDTAKRNGTYQKNVERIRRMGIENRKYGSDHPVSKKVYLYDGNLEFIRAFDTITYCANFIGANTSHISKYMNGVGSVKGMYVFDHIATNEELLSVGKSRFIPIIVRDVNGSSFSFKSIAEAARWLKTDKSYIHLLVKRGIKVYKNFKIEANGKHSL